MTRPPEQTLRELVGEGRAYVAAGQVTDLQAHPSWGYLLDVTLRPSGRQLQARLLGWGASGWAPVVVDDEVLVLLPDGDPNRAVAVAGLPSDASPIPSSYDRSRVEIVHAGGLRTRTSGGAATRAVVTVDLLGDLQTALTEIQAALAGLGLPTTQLAALIAKLPTFFRSSALETE